MKDDDKLVICRKCIVDFDNITYTNPFQYRGLFTNYIPPDKSENFICPICKEELYETSVTGKEIKILFNICHDNNFLRSMINLKESDPIEYQLKMSQFKANLGQQQKSSQRENSNIPKCPTCQSTNIQKISGLSKAGSVAMWGIFSQKVKKIWHCNGCGYEW